MPPWSMSQIVVGGFVIGALVVGLKLYLIG